LTVKLKNSLYFPNFFHFLGYGRSESEKVHEKVPRRIEIPVVGVDTCYRGHPSFYKIKSDESFCVGKPGVVPCNGQHKTSNFGQ
jgi:hypothetical protein